MLYATLFATLRNLRKWSLESMTHTKLYFRHAVAVFYNSISLFIIHFLVNSIMNRKLYLAKSCNSNEKKPSCRFFHGKIKQESSFQQVSYYRDKIRREVTQRNEKTEKPMQVHLGERILVLLSDGLQTLRGETLFNRFFLRIGR